MQTNTITIVGMGRVGVSIGLALRKASIPFILVGHDSENRRAQEALKLHGAVDQAERSLPKAAAMADILVLAMPAVELETTLRAIADEVQEHTLIIDLTRLKGPGMKWAEQLLRRGHYVGARPVFAAATFDNVRTDPSAARADLFENSIFCVMPAASTDPKAVETAVNFGYLLGAKPYFVDPWEYDGLVQGVETMPGLLATALFSTVHSSAGWRDILRFADLPFALATLPLGDVGPDEIAFLALNDKAATLRWLDAYIAELTQLKQRVYEGDRDALTALLSDLENDREQWLSERKKNEWVEGEKPDMSGISFSQQMLGGLVTRRGRDDKKR